MTQRVVEGLGTQRHAGVEGTSASRSGRAGGVLPRTGLSLAGCVAATGFVLGVAGPRVGGQAQGEVLVWVLCLPALVVVPGALLRASIGWPVLLNAALAMAAVVWLLVPTAVADAHPTGARLAQDVSALVVPPGQRVVERLEGERPVRDDTATTAGAALVSVAAGRRGGAVPVPPSTWPVASPLSATRAGRDAAAAWGRSLQAAGFTRAAGDRFERGRWTSAWVVAHGDGAVVVLAARG